MTLELPSFDRPPLTEVFLAVQHVPLARLRTQHQGMFLASLGADWEPMPDIQPIGQTHEPVEDVPEWLLPGTLEIDLRSGVRMRTRKRAGDRLVQVENGWLAFNWTGSETPYPRWGSLRKEFDDHVSAWRSFVTVHGLGDVVPNLWEVGYVNVFPKGDLWQQPADWTSLLPGLFGSAGPRAGLLQTASARWAHLIASGVGRLQILLEHGLQGRRGEIECLFLRLVARGPAKEPSFAAVDAGLEIGHQSIVTTFASLLSEEALNRFQFRR